MTKYNSFHFSPENNRSILMPRLPKQEAFAKALKNHMVRPKYPPIPEEKLNKYPYFQCNLGLHLKQLSVGGELRHYGVYVPDGMIGKGLGLVLFLPAGVTAENFPQYENWQALAEKYLPAGKQPGGLVRGASGEGLRFCVGGCQFGVFRKTDGGCVRILLLSHRSGGCRSGGCVLRADL